MTNLRARVMLKTSPVFSSDGAYPPGCASFGTKLAEQAKLAAFLNAQAKPSPLWRPGVPARSAGMSEKRRPEQRIPKKIQQAGEVQ